ncbi:beta-keto acid cleavage enzyme (plasmid) [Caballeronia sp. SBC1]|nr:beta-keto acid cleavage enzyme [Caballeronia sp. SBC2]QIN65371.1 beta-keto acid cleavage enzyme [Caballeronia sp. SBC1]
MRDRLFETIDTGCLNDEDLPWMPYAPDGAMLTVESSMRSLLPVNMMGIAMGLHVRCGIADNIWNQARTKRMSSVEQIEQLVRISREFGREMATAQQARDQQDWHVLRHSGRDPAGQRLRAQPQRW